MTGPTGEFNIAQAQRPRRAEDSFSPPGDYFAPFFDVIFYRPSPLQGTVENPAEQAELLKTSNPSTAAQLRSNPELFTGQPVSPVDIAGTDELGASRIQLRSIGGGLQTFDPAGPDSPLGQLVNYRASLQVTMLSAAALQATLTLTPPYEDATRIIDAEVIKFGSLMEIQWGYLSTDGSQKPAISDKGLFRITQPSIKFGREVTITIGGFDILSSSLSTADVRCCWPRAKYPCDLSIIKDLVSKRAPHGTKLIDTSVSNESPLRKKKERDVIQSDSDWTFFRRLCRQNDVAFEQKGSEIILKDENRIDIAPAKYRLTWFMQPQGKLDIPMISFETNPILGYFAQEGSRGQRTICRDPDTGKLEVVNKDPGDTGTAQVGGKGVDAQKKGFKTDTMKTSDGASIGAFGDVDEVCASGRIYTQPCKRPNQMEETERKNREVRRFHNTRASAVVPGVPGLIPQQICEVVNVGKTFSGCYRVMKTIHTIGSGYTVKVDLIRASSVGVGADDAPASRDRANCEPLKPEQETGEEVTPSTANVDPPVQSTGAIDAGCVVPQSQEIANQAQRIINDTFGFF